MIHQRATIRRRNCGILEFNDNAPLALLGEGHELNFVARCGNIRNECLSGLDAVARLRGSRRCTAAQPRELLARQILAALLHGIGLPGSLSAGESPVIVTALVRINHAIVNLPRGRGNGVEEPAIVGDNDDRQLAGKQVLRQPLHAFHVEVVRWLIEHHHIKVLHQRGRKIHTAALTTG